MKAKRRWLEQMAQLGNTAMRNEKRNVSEPFGALLKTPNETLAQDWEADAALTTEERNAGKATFSDKWLSDRAAMAAWQAIGNIANEEKIGRNDAEGTTLTKIIPHWRGGDAANETCWGAAA